MLYQVRSDSVSSPVEIVKTLLPQKLAGQDINGKATGAFGEHGGVNADEPLQHKRESALLELSRLAEVMRSGGVGCSIQILTARVAEVDGRGVDDGTASFLGLIMDNSSVGARGRDGRERKTSEKLALGADLLQLVRPIDFIQSCFLVDQFVFEPGKVLSQSSTIPNVTGPHTLQLGLVLDCLGICDRATALFSLLLAPQTEAQCPRSLVRQQELFRAIARLGPGHTQSLGVGEDRIVRFDDHILPQMSLDLGGQLFILHVKLCRSGRDHGI